MTDAITPFALLREITIQDGPALLAEAGGLMSEAAFREALEARLAARLGGRAAALDQIDGAGRRRAVSAVAWGRATLVVMGLVAPDDGSEHVRLAFGPQPDLAAAAGTRPA